MEEFKIL